MTFEIENNLNRLRHKWSDEKAELEMLKIEKAALEDTEDKDLELIKGLNYKIVQSEIKVQQSYIEYLQCMKAYDPSTLQQCDNEIASRKKLVEKLEIQRDDFEGIITIEDFDSHPM